MQIRARRTSARLSPVALSAAILLTASVMPALARDPVTPVQAVGTLPEDQLLDVGIEVFETSDDARKPVATADQQILEDLRKAEGRYLPVRLREVLESTGQWGAVRVLPPGLSLADLTITGEIIDANGRRLELWLRVVDSRGKRWFEREYYWQAEARDYPKGASSPQFPFQSVFSQISNDLVHARDKRKAQEIREIREITEMRFAAETAPAAFGDHIRSRGQGRFELARLPATDDPMLARVRKIRERDQMVVDTLNEHYSIFRSRMEVPYAEWLAQSFQEVKAYESLHNKSVWKKILGAALIVGAVAAGSDGGSSLGTDIMVVGGIAAIESGIKDGREKKIHQDTLGELATQLEAGITPLVVDVEGRTIELKGTAEEQYAAWRKMLGEILVTETDLPVDPNLTAPTE